MGHIAQILGSTEEALDDLSNENVYESIERLKRLIRISPHLAQPYQDLAFCYSELGQYGLAQESYKKGMLLDREGIPLSSPMAALSEIGHITQKKVEETLFAHIIKPDVPSPKKEGTPLVESMLSDCKVVNYIVKKAKETHYLDNSERVTLLYTLGILGQEGKEFLHKVISNCINYDYDYTEKRIKKMKLYPISSTGSGRNMRISPWI